MVANQGLQTDYINALIKEINSNHLKLQQLQTIYIGGGTPSSLTPDNLTKLLATIQGVVHMNSIKEYTIETNPNDITQEFIDIIKTYGINRVSLGVQTIQDMHLKFLNRTHCKKDVIQAIKLLRENQIWNINLDFIYSIPGQTIKDIQLDLEFIQHDFRDESSCSAVVNAPWGGSVEYFHRTEEYQRVSHQ